MTSILTWASFGLLLILATAPVWRLAIVGLDPSLDQLMEIVCGPGE